MSHTPHYDVIVVGAGHAGCEAAHAAAIMGRRTLLLTLSLDAVANMPCNPSVGGSSKGHIVREIDALGGIMGVVADCTSLQSRILGQSRGPAVQSLRVQSDRRAYNARMKRLLESTPNLSLRQGEVCDITVADGRVRSVTLRSGYRYDCDAVVLATGTYLAGRVHVGEASYDSGPDCSAPSVLLCERLHELGVPLRRFKTGTPPRILASSVDYAALQSQHSESGVGGFSFDPSHYDGNALRDSAVCHITYTNQHTHDLIRANLHRSPLYAGRIEGVGPRYCPSIEDKVMRFADKDRHQLFIEPTGHESGELYVGGLSTSLPEDVQDDLVHSIAGLENAVITRYGYAIEYACVDTLHLYPTLGYKDILGLYFGGQICGTSGYEEAAAGGLVAGINAAAMLNGQEPLILSRSDGYIGVMVGDLTTKGTDEPYRMMTARCEHRLLLRADNADMRLSGYGHRYGLISDGRYAATQRRYAQIAEAIELLRQTVLPPSDAVNTMLAGAGTAPLTTGATAYALLCRPEVRVDLLRDVMALPYGDDVLRSAEIDVKYAGYIEKQRREYEREQKYENRRIPDGFVYDGIPGMRIEASKALARIRPMTVGQAAQVRGVNPADVTALVVALIRG